MDMRPTGPGATARMPPRAPILQRMQGDNNLMDNMRTLGELPVIQDLTPAVTDDGVNESHTSVDGSMDVDPILSPPIPMNGHHNVGGGSGFRGGRGGGRSIFPGEVHNFRPERRNDKTLVVEKIPEDKLSLDAVNGWFKRFGTVTNVAVDAANAKALVSFSTHEEAQAAWRCEDAVFGNRFVKLFWHRPMEGHGIVGARMLAASAPLVAAVSNKKAAPSIPPAAPAATPTASPSAPRKKPPTQSTTATAAIAAKQRLLEQQITEQKRLMGLLESASGDEKKQIMIRLRQLGEEMKKPSADKIPLTPATTTTEKSTTTTSASTVKPQSGDRERKERELLDRELELHSAVGAVGNVVDQAEESTEDLKAKLEKLKAEVCISSNHTPCKC
jgi:RNA-binding protein 26